MQAYAIVTARMIASCMTKVASGFPVRECVSAWTLAAILGPREAMLSFCLHPSSFFCNLALFILGWH